jgi:hypothetical protein
MCEQNSDALRRGNAKVCSSVIASAGTHTRVIYREGAVADELKSRQLDGRASIH